MLRPLSGSEAYFFLAAFFVAFLAAFLTAFFAAFLAAFLVAFFIDSFSLTSKFTIPYEIAACFIYKVSELQCQEKNRKRERRAPERNMRSLFYNVSF